MKNSTRLLDFSFRPSGHGSYEVTYTSPKTGKTWKTFVNDMTIIDATKNAESPKKIDLDRLKNICKNN